MKRLAFLAAILFLSLTTPARAGLEEGVAAYKRGDYATAFREFLPLAQAGDASAQSYLSSMYFYGRGVTQDYKEAVRWNRKAAEQGNAGALYNLGNMYEYGQGVSQDYKEAVRWYRKAAEKGFASAQYNLGVLNYNGRGVTRDLVQVHMWFNLAASNYPRRIDSDKAIKGRDLVAKRLSREQLSRAQRLAREWRPKP